MIIFLYGEDNFRSLQKLNKIVEHYKEIHKSGLNLRYFDFQKDSFEDFKDQFQTKSMFKEKKLLVLKNSFSNTQFKERFKKSRKKFLKSQNIILFYENKNLSEKDPFFVFLKANSMSQRFDNLEGEKLENWLKKESSEHKVEIEAEARRLLIQYVGNDLWQLSNELKKLANYKWNPKKTTITKEDVESLISQKTELNIFRTIDFIAKKQKEKALFLIHKHLDKGDAPLYLLSMINFQFRNLLILKARSCPTNTIWTRRSNASGKEFGIHPFVVKKLSGLCKKFTLEELKKIYQKIFQIDLAIKTGEVNPELALDLLIAQI